MRTANSHVLKYAEYAMSLSMGGKPVAAVDELILRGEETLNSKLVESAFMVIERYSAKIGDTKELYARVEVLRGKCSGSKTRAGQADGPRKAGALSLRTGAAKAKAATT